MCMLYDGSVSHESIELRPAEQEDFAHIQRLHQYAYLCNADESLGLTPEVMYHHVYGPADDGRPSFGERIMASYERWTANDASHFTVATINGVPAGYTTTVNYDTLSLLDGLYVDPTLHGRGIGTLLFAACRSRCHAAAASMGGRACSGSRLL